MRHLAHLARVLQHQVCIDEYTIYPFAHNMLQVDMLSIFKARSSSETSSKVNFEDLKQKQDSILLDSSWGGG
ncbi:hypothetical protein [uncultured Helicobacter sp.]|uniref:hypothetical protein n=1 Tax=uncultured Helicobacter sp. TaxID=175537 RepID=UPI0026088F94|nr:hypothetical protein [uncultured Helicobacter sp.]